ncbi:hypothetical protein JK628_07815 [Shewanella sp. KX20019]|uniref:hypothetical protein n=1 Tax=Shewanella sp. KX20019 TaxID=2803864 RepID=UPI0019253065|nr:hypothetical protein [Shewanella sp. KX20019]QQX81731.1 hypothetical protein JK628_07815 [Shewanella sp. KX20019]
MTKNMFISSTEWIAEQIAEKLLLLLAAGVLVACIQYFNYQEHQAITEAAKQAEIIKIKLSMITEH